MDYILKGRLTMGGSNALLENNKKINNEVLKEIDKIADGNDITRDIVEQSLQK